MFKTSNICWAIGAFFVLFYTTIAYSKEYSLEADVDARAEYNSNIFLTSQPHDATKGIIITPSLSGIIKETHWIASLNARIKSHNYSDDNLDSNDQFLSLTGQYGAERNIFSLNARYDLASNLNATSSDFGTVGRRVNTKLQSITPQYTRLLTERSSLILSYAYTDVDFLEAENTGYTPYITETGSGSLIYDLTEKDKLTFSLQAVDYESKNDLVTYLMFISRFGIDHKFSQTLSTDFLVGVSRQSSTNLTTQTFDFFGNVILQTQEIDVKNRGLVLDAGVMKRLERGSLDGRISRDNTTDSFGGLNQVDRLKINYKEKLSSLWSYRISARIEDITSLSVDNRSSDRDVLFFDTIVSYSISSKWNANASYRYVQRKYKSDTSDNRAPHSNRIYVGLTYNFPSLSTF